MKYGKRKIAKRNLRSECLFCNNVPLKGEVYYDERIVAQEEGSVYAWTARTCARCKYEREEHSVRFIKFIEHCHHPKAMVGINHSYYVTGNRECWICREIFYEEN